MLTNEIFVEYGCVVWNLGWMRERLNGQTNEWLKGWMNKRMEEWKNGMDLCGSCTAEVEFEFSTLYRVTGHDLLLEHIILNISTNSGWFYMKLSQQGSFLQDNQNKGSQPYVSTIITHNPKYLNQFWMVLHETFTTGFIFARQLKQGVTTLCFDHNCT